MHYNMTQALILPYYHTNSSNTINFVVSGCDYVTFFSQLGKAIFMRYFFRYASFISAGDQRNTLVQEH